MSTGGSNQINYVTGEVIERSPAVFLRQITGQNDVLLKTTDVQSIYFDLWIVPMSRSRYIEIFGALPFRDSSLLPPNSSGSPVQIVAQKYLTVTEVMFDTPQLDNRWTQDAIGYNFAVMLGPQDFPLINIANYPTPQWIEVWFSFLPYVGDLFVVPFIVKEGFSLAGRTMASGSGS